VLHVLKSLAGLRFLLKPVNSCSYWNNYVLIKIIDFFKFLARKNITRSCGSGFRRIELELIFIVQYLSLLLKRIWPDLHSFLPDLDT
jgi:hypothetical protein